jgi:hypothetical protein
VREHLYGHGLISQDDMSLIHVTDQVDEAVRVITTFYKVFHSYRHVKDRTVFRIKRKLTPAAVAKLNTDFADVIKEPLEQASALPEEQNEEGISHLPRLIGILKHGEYGRWRQLIDAINMAQVIPAKL